MDRENYFIEVCYGSGWLTGRWQSGTLNKLPERHFPFNLSTVRNVGYAVKSEAGLDGSSFGH